MMDENANLKNKTLLVLAPSYPDEKNAHIAGIFVKHQNEEIKNYFQKIIVISPVLFAFNISEKEKLCKNYTYENVTVFYPRCLYMPFSWSNKIIFDTRPAAVETVIRQNNLRFDLIHAHFTWPSGQIALMLKKKFNVPVITTIHENNEWFKDELRMNNPRINQIWSKSDAIIRVNRKNVPALQHFNEKTFYIPDGFSSRFHPIAKETARAHLRLSTHIRIIFSFGNLIERKGFAYLIDAISALHHSDCIVHCYIGGSGPLKKDLEQKIRDLGMEEYIQLIGFVSEDALPYWINASDIFVIPSIEESFGIVQIEALACGKPVVATINGGSEEILTPFIDGILCTPGSAPDLADAIGKAIDHRWDTDEILRNASEYSWEKIAIEIIGKYQMLLKK